MVRNSVRSLLSATLLGSSILAGMAIHSPVHAQKAGTERRYDIPPGTLADALNRFAEQSGVQISYEAELADDRRSSGLRGSYTRADALSRLLAGSGLVARDAGENGISIARATSGRIDLDPMEVRDSVVAAGTGDARSDGDGPHGYGGADTIIVTALRLETAISGLKTDTPLLETPQAISVVNMEEARVASASASATVACA
ncbi:secretin and TonB N-terminal domain-containing protein [Sphingobium sufflavum]|uniref:STN domain-containing protein n=1 Tax=Sphingobium sufflavum TaxID=1129547 RepID=UPI001F3BD44D|nr:STN domain-containing protein [Sphingobium sufflavum]MCE7796429.1 secretin and TonB N-terminal domain-containing protein [Sphingobium sufflavum]